MENTKIQDMSVVQLKAHLYDLQGYVQLVQNVLQQKVEAEKLPPVADKKE